MSNIILQTHNISKKYGSFSAVDGMDMEVQQGEIYGLIGKNGAGKTTLLKMVSGLAMPTSGNLELFGKSAPKEVEQMRSRTGSIIETPAFFPYLSAERNLEYYRIQRGIADRNCVQESLKFVGLINTGKKRFKNFSLGMKQRLGLALAIMNNPDFLILDEPINGLDPIGMTEFREIILKLNHERNTTILISSHILSELSQIATTYSFINNGRLVEHISSAQLQEKCKRCLKIQVDDVNKASMILQNQLSCSSYQILGDHEMQIDEFLDKPEILVKALVQNDVMISSVYQTGLNLEEYFIELVGGMKNA